MSGHGGIEWGTQQKNVYMKLAVTNRISVTATLGRINEASHCNGLTKCCYDSERNERQGVTCWA